MIMTGFYTLTGDDFNDTIITFDKQSESTEMGIFTVRLVNITRDDNINEIEQSFALVVQLGYDAPDNFTCFSRDTLVILNALGELVSQKFESPTMTVNII